MRLKEDQQRELIDSVRRESARIGMDPQTMLTIMSYETGGTLDPWQKGPTTKWGQHVGLIQMGGPQRKQYGYTKDAPISKKVKAVADYFVDRGWKPGMGEMNAYSIVNAGGPGLFHRSDAHVGGAPGTVADKVQSANWKGHARKIRDFLGKFPEDTGLVDFATKTERGADLANIMAGQSGSPTGPGIFDAFNTVASTNLTATPTPQAKLANPANRAFADNAVGNLVDPRQANTSPRTVEEMLSGAPEGSFLPGGPIERYLSRQDQPAPLGAAPRGIVERGRDLGPLPSRNAPATVSRNAFDTVRGEAPSGMFGPMSDVANARVANAFADVAQPRDISAVATSDVDSEIQAGLSRNPFDTMRGTPAGELPAVPGISYVAPQPAPQVAQPAPTVAPPTVQQAMQPLQAPQSIQPRQVFTDIPTRTVTGAVPGVAEKVAEYGGAPDPGNGMSYGRSPFGSGVALVHDNAPDYVKTAATGPGLFGAFERDFGINLEPLANKALIGGAGLVAGPALMTGGALLGGGIGAGVAGLAPFAARQVGNKYGGGLFGDPFNDQVQANRQAANQRQAAQSNLSRPEMALRRGLSGGVDFLTGGMFRPDFGGGNGSMFGGGGNSSNGGLFSSIGRAFGGLFGGRDRNDMGGGLFSGSNNLGGVGGRDASGALM